MAGKKTVLSLKNMKKNGEKIAMVSVYDYAFASIARRAAPDILLVGDSMQMVLYGSEDTLDLDMDTMIRHCRAVRKAAPDIFLTGDMPFGSFQVSDEQAVENAVRLLREGRCDAVKLEGGAAMSGRIRAITAAGIPVCAHVGLTPQRAGLLGGHRIQGRGTEAARQVLNDALAVREAGAVMTVLECVPENLGAYISGVLDIPVIGIGSGAGTDGQVLVFHDLFDLAADFEAKLVKVYKSLKGEMEDGVADFVREVRAGAFPTAENSFGGLEDADLDKLKNELR